MDLRRPRLIRRLHNAVKHPVTVITAPAGYGKTVLVDQWAAQHDGPPVARVAIGPEDDWPRVAARIDAELPPTEEAILVIDAVDRSSDELLARELAALLEHVPAALHLVLVSRSRAVPALDRLHGRTDVAFVTAADLAFTGNEVRLLVRAVSGLKLADAQIAQLQTRTEGMAAGLEVAAIGLRETPDPEAYVESFAGDERHLAAFLVGEVLAPQPPVLRRFLVQTSVLDRLNGSLCDAVTGGGDGAVTLRRLEHGGVFIRRLPGSREWFTCHPLFRDVLRSELRRGEYGDEDELHTRAGAWWAAHHDAAAAARHFIEAGDWNRVVGLADAFGREMYESGRADEVLQWLGALRGTHARQADVGLRRAYLHTMVGETQHATQIVHDLEASGLSRGERVAADALRSAWAFFDATPEAAIKAADDALSALQAIELGQLPDIFGMTAPTSMAMMAASSRARALWYLGDVGEARRVLTAGVKQQDVYTPWLLRTLSALAMLDAWAGNLRLARTHGVRASAIATRTGLVDHPAMLDTRLALACVCRERGDLARAARLLDEAAQIAGASRRPHTTAILVTERARWYLAAGQPGEGLAVLERYRAERESAPPPLIDANLRAAEASLFVSVDDLDRAESVLGSAAGASFCPDLAAVGVQAAVARHDLEAAAERLGDWPVDDVQRRHRLQRDLWAAVVDFEAGDRRRAIQILSGVVDAAEREGDTRLFLDGGRPVERLLRALVHAAPLPYAQRLVRAAQLAQDPGKGTVLGLSKRELEVACYLPTPLSSAEIAERLYISLNTLKTHLRTIYSKLGATNRREAIQRAEELGIA